MKFVQLQTLFDAYGNSMGTLLSNLFPEYNWHLWRFGSVPKGYWNDVENQRSFMDWFGNKIGMKKYDDWLNISRQQLEMGGKTLSNIQKIHNNSIEKLFSCVYPNFEWHPWMFKRLRYFAWSEEINIRTYLLWVSEKLNIERYIHIYIGILSHRYHWNIDIEQRIGIRFTI
jgi:hypothetical protein